MRVPGTREVVDGLAERARRVTLIEDQDLVTAAAVTEAHGGTAEAQPTPGGGVTFVITLPLDAD